MQRASTWPTWDSEGVFSVFLFYQCFLYILFAVVFIYITQNSSLDALTSFINGLTVFLHVSSVCLMTKNPDMPQLPCQLDSLIFWDFFDSISPMYTCWCWFQPTGWKFYLSRPLCKALDWLIYTVTYNFSSPEILSVFSMSFMSYLWNVSLP